MGALPGYPKGKFPGSWHIEKTCVAAIIGPYLEDRFNAGPILDAAAPTESDWNFLSNRAQVIDGGSRMPSANAWRQAILETFAWGQRR